MPTLGPCASGVVQIPVKGLGQYETLSRLQAECIHVGSKYKKSSEALTAFYDAKFRRLLDRIDGIAARVRKTNDFGLRRLRLQQERCEVAGIDRVADLAKNFATVRLNDRHRIAFKRVTESVVRGQKEPGIASSFNHG